MLLTHAGRAALVLSFSLLLFPACDNNGDGSGGGVVGGFPVPTGTVRILLGDAPVDELLLFAAVVEAIQLEDDTGELTANLLSAPMPVEFLGLQDSFLWLAEDEVEEGTYVAAHVSFEPFAYLARDFDGDRLVVDALSDVLVAEIVFDAVVAGGDLLAIPVDLDLRSSIRGDASSGTITFEPRGAARVAFPGEQIPVEEVDAVVVASNQGTLDLVVDTFADEEMRVPVARASVFVDAFTLLVDRNGNPLQPPTALFFTVLAPGITLIEIHGALVSDGQLIADRIEIEDQDGGAGSTFPIKLDGRVDAIQPGVILLLLQDVEKGVQFAEPILEGLGRPVNPRVSLSTQKLRTYFGNQFLLPNAPQVGDRLKIKFLNFSAEPFPAARVSLVDVAPLTFGAIVDVGDLPDAFIMHVRPTEPAVVSGEIASDTTDTRVELLDGAVAVPLGSGASETGPTRIVLDTFGEPVLSRDDLLPGLEIRVTGGVSGDPDQPLIDAFDVVVYPGILEDADVVAIDRASSSLSTLGGTLVGSFGEDVSEGPFTIELQFGAVYLGEAASEAQLFDLFDALAPGEELRISVQGIAATDDATVLRAYQVVSGVVSS